MIIDRHMGYQISKDALDYLVTKQDLGTMINHMAQERTNDNIFELFAQQHQSVSNNCGFDSQLNTGISEVIKSDAEKLLICDLFVGYDYPRLEKKLRGILKKTSFGRKGIDSDDLEATAFL